jgi:hypothetical protein
MLRGIDDGQISSLLGLHDRLSRMPNGIDESSKHSGHKLPDRRAEIRYAVSCSCGDECLPDTIGKGQVSGCLTTAAVHVGEYQIDNFELLAATSLDSELLALAEWMR